MSHLGQSHPNRRRAALALVFGVLILGLIQWLDGLTVEHLRILVYGVGYGLLLAGALEAAAIPFAVRVTRAVQRWRSNAP